MNSITKRFYMLMEKLRRETAPQIKAAAVLQQIAPTPPMLLLPPPQRAAQRTSAECAKPEREPEEKGKPYFQRLHEERQALFAKYGWKVGETVFVNNHPSWLIGHGLTFPIWSGVGVIRRIDYGYYLTITGETHEAVIEPEQYSRVSRH